MKIIFGDHSTGKTKELVKEAFLQKGAIVCKDVKRMTDKVVAYGYLGVDIIDYDTFLQEVNLHTNKRYFVRNAEELLSKMNIIELSLSGEQEQDNLNEFNTILVDVE